MNVKRLSIFFGFILLLFVALFVINQSQTTVYGKPKSRLNPATREILHDPNYRNILLPDELDRKLAKKESFFVYYFASDCIHCRTTTPYVKPLADEMGIDLHLFNLREFPKYVNKMRIEATPTLVYYKEGLEVDRIKGGITTGGSEGHTLDDFRKFFETNRTEGDT
jgi:thiol-disulfide isomerase/thioredoxin